MACPRHGPPSEEVCAGTKSPGAPDLTAIDQSTKTKQWLRSFYLSVILKAQLLVGEGVFVGTLGAVLWDISHNKPSNLILKADANQISS